MDRRRAESDDSRERRERIGKFKRVECINLRKFPYNCPKSKVETVERRHILRRKGTLCTMHETFNGAS